MTRPQLRHDTRCWCGCGRFAARVELKSYPDDVLAALKAHPRACFAHRDFVAAELERQVAKWRARQTA